MITVACVYRSGGRYSPLWVQKLRSAVSSNMGRHRFVCLTDRPLTVEQWGVTPIPLRHNWPGWWSKIELFRPDLFHGPVLYIDLDSLITGPLDGLVRHTPGITMTEDFYLGAGHHNSSTMSWNGDYSGIYRSFHSMPGHWQEAYTKREDGRIGDQAFIEDTLRAIGVRIGTFEPGRVVSFKKHARYAPAIGARIVQFHGDPKPDEAEGWARDTWEQ